MGRFIRMGEWIRFRRGDYVNHWAVVDRIEDGVVYVIQARLTGVTDRLPIDSVGEYFTMRPPLGVDVDRQMEFLRAQVGDRYGLLTIDSIAIDLVTYDWVPAFRSSWTWICSALVAEAGRYGGWLHDWGDIYAVNPAQLWTAVAPIGMLTESLR